MKGEPRALTVFYDGWCPLCTGIKHRLVRLDWLGQLAFASMREPGVAEEVGFPARRLAERMHVRINKTGRVVDGIDAVVAIAGRVPALWPLWPLLLLSAWTGLGERLYDFIAARRTIIPVGACDENGCPIHHQPR
ncbi:MAG: thiol-disulfide oxidoreductase DCC family protein [Bacillota bacterium]